MRWCRGSRELIVQLSPCIVSSPPLLPKSPLTILLNPANESLVGTRLAYFPIGGPCPDIPPPGAETSNSWSGMDIGGNMMYPAQCVDGIVHRESGPQLLSWLRARQGRKLKAGEAVMSPSFRLTGKFDAIIHAVSPFHYLSKGWEGAAGEEGRVRWERELALCYSTAITRSKDCIVENQVDSAHIITPILGSGARGGPLDEAMMVAVRSLGAWLLGGDPLPVTVTVCLPSHKKDAADMFRKCMEGIRIH